MIHIFSYILIFFSLSFLILFLYSLTRQRNSLSTLFACLCLTIAIYIGGYAMELRAESMEAILFAIQAEYFGAPFMSIFWLLICYKYLFKKPASAGFVLLITAIPLITLFLAVTNDFHHLIYTDISVLSYGDDLLVQLEKGPWYYVNILFSYSVQCFGMVVFFRTWRTKGYQFRTQAFWMFWGSIWPGLFNLVYIAGFSPMNLDLTPFGLSITGICFCIAIFRYGLLELQEIVKDVTFMEIEEGILVLDNKNRLIDFNQACKEIFSWLDPSLIGIDIATFPEGKRILARTAQRFEMKIVNGKSQKCYEFRKTPLMDQDTHLGFVYFIQDITRQKELIRELHDIASFDSLTQVFNRRKLMDALEKEILRMERYGHCMSVLMIDIDHFKVVNDQYGHQAGDEVLKTLAAACRARIRRTDIIGRYGGEEFMIILPEINENDALIVAETIRKTISDLEFLSNHSAIHITISIGVKTIFSYYENLSVEAVIRGADRALYRAKNAGRNRSSIDTEN